MLILKNAIIVRVTLIVTLSPHLQNLAQFLQMIPTALSADDTFFLYFLFTAYKYSASRGLCVGWQIFFSKTQARSHSMEINRSRANVRKSVFHLLNFLIL